MCICACVYVKHLSIIYFQTSDFIFAHLSFLTFFLSFLQLYLNTHLIKHAMLNCKSLRAQVLATDWLGSYSDKIHSTPGFVILGKLLKLLK